VVSELPVESRRHLIEQGRQRLLGEPGGETVATSGGETASLFNSRGPELDATARRTLEVLKVDAPIHLDDLIEKMENSSPSELIAALFELEMQGLVKQLPGKNFVKVW
jgi:DNA processing protein